MKYADRGLVYNGYPNVKLLNYLYWISLLTYVSYSYGVFPLSQQLRGEFPQNSIKGQICMKIDFQLDEMNTKHRVKTFTMPTLATIFAFLFMKTINDYVKGQSLKMKTFSQFGGKHQRNMFTLTQNIFYLSFCICFIFLDNGLITLLQLFRGNIGKDSQFTIHNFLWVGCLDLFFGIYVPVKHIIISRKCLPGLWWKNRTVQVSKFYVRKQNLIPRRYVEPALVMKDNSERQNKKNSGCLPKSSKNQIKTTLNETKQSTSKVHNLKQNFSMPNFKNQLTPISE